MITFIKVIANVKVIAKDVCSYLLPPLLLAFCFMLVGISIFGAIGFIICLFGYMSVGLEGIKVAGSIAFISTIYIVTICTIAVWIKRAIVDYFKDVSERAKEIV